MLIIGINPGKVCGAQVECHRTLWEISLAEIPILFPEIL